MKTIFFSAILLLCLYNSEAQTILKGENGHVLGYIESGNIFYDLESRKMLDFSSDGEIKNGAGDITGTYNRETGEVKDLNGDLLFSFDGTTLKSANGVSIGSVDGSGNLKDESNYIIGTALSVDKYYLTFFIYVYNRM
jgi:hypothetical protein